jgi:uncharacterized protein (DUF1778 family)
MPKKRSKRKTGPKPKPADEVQSERLELRVTPPEREAVETAADEQGETVTGVIRRLIREQLMGE